MAALISRFAELATLMHGQEWLGRARRTENETRTGDRRYWALNILCAGIALPACVMAVNADIQPTFSAAHLKAHVVTLASDAFEGRLPGTRGESKTVAYIASQMDKAGLTPAVGNGWRQPVKIVVTRPGSRAEMSIMDSGQKLRLTRDRDYVLWSDSTDPPRDVASAPLVFVGYGIFAPTANIDDYKNVDVRGKIVVLLEGSPPFPKDTSINVWDGRQFARFSPTSYDPMAEAARRGAVGAVMLHSMQSEYPWSVIKASWGTSRMTLDMPSQDAPQPGFCAWLHEDSVPAVLRSGGLTLEIAREIAARPDFVPHSLSLTASVKLLPVIKHLTSYNVIGKVAGTVTGESVLYTAHWDQFGVKTTTRGREIFHGAMDNATGVSALIELGRAFAHARRPRRTVFFAAVTAEEEGLLGALWYVRHPLLPLAKLAANLNIDTLMATGKARDIIQFGRGRLPSLDQIIDDEAAKVAKVVSSESESSEEVYAREDGLVFAQAGVPVVVLMGGTDDVAHGKLWGEAQMKAYDTDRYHQPSDDASAYTDYRGTAQDLKIWYGIGRRVADDSAWPTWSSTAEFRALRTASDADRTP